MHSPHSEVPPMDHLRVHNNPQIPGTPEMPNSEQTPGRTQTNGHPQIVNHQQIPGYQQVPNYSQVPPQMPNYQQIPSHSQMPAGTIPQIPGYPQIPGPPQMPSYPPALGYQPTGPQLYTVVEYRVYGPAPPPSHTSTPGTVSAAPYSNVHSPNTGLPAPSNPAIPGYPLPGYHGLDSRHLTPAGFPADKTIPPSFHTTGANSSILSPNAGIPATSPVAATPEGSPEREIIIALMGVTGAGKSYFIKEVSGNSQVEVNGGLSSCTNKVQSYSFEYKGVKITLVDTPGFNDTNRSDMEVLREFSNWASEAYAEERLLSGIIYLHPITRVRMEGSAQRNLKMFQSLCGQKALKNVFLTTTQWSKVDPAEGEFRENGLQNQDFWGGLLGKGATLQRFRGTRESGLELIHKLMSNVPKPLDIQEQIFNQKRTLLETDAGKCINEELISREKKYQEELESLRRKYKEAIEAADNEMKEILGAEQAKAQEKLGKITAERKLWESVHAEDLRRRKAVIAVATKDISIFAHYINMFTNHATKGRLVFDIHNHEEFKSKTFDVAIHFNRNLLAGYQATTKTLQGFFNLGMGKTNYIVYEGGHYVCRSGYPITIDGQDFVIFSRE